MNKNNKRGAIFITRQPVPRDKIKNRIDYYFLDEDYILEFTSKDQIWDLVETIKNDCSVDNCFKIAKAFKKLRKQLKDSQLVLLVTELPTDILNFASDYLSINMEPYYVDSYLSEEASFTPAHCNIWLSVYDTMMILVKDKETEERLSQEIFEFEHEHQIRFDKFLVSPETNKHAYKELEKVLGNITKQNVDSFMEYFKHYSPYGKAFDIIVVEPNNKELDEIAKLTNLKVIYLNK